MAHVDVFRDVPASGPEVCNFKTTSKPLSDSSIEFIAASFEGHEATQVTATISEVKAACGAE